MIDQYFFLKYVVKYKISLQSDKKIVHYVKTFVRVWHYLAQFFL